MPAPIELARIIEFQSNVRLTLGRDKAMLTDLVRVRTDPKGEGYRPEMTSGRVRAQRRLTRNEDKTPQETSLAGRWLEPEDFDIAPLTEDSLDTIRNGMKMEGSYVQAVVSAINIAKDDMILDKAVATAKIGKFGNGGTAAFDDTNMRVASGSAGLTINKAIEFRKKFKKRHVDLRAETVNLVHNENQWGDLMRDVQFTSSEFASGKPLETAEANRLLKMNLVEFSSDDFPLALVAGEQRCVGWVKSGIELALYEVGEPNVWQNRNKRGDPWWIDGKFTIGASRLDEFKVGDILCV